MARGVGVSVSAHPCRKKIILFLWLAIAACIGSMPAAAENSEYCRIFGDGNERVLEHGAPLGTLPQSLVSELHNLGFVEAKGSPEIPPSLQRMAQNDPETHSFLTYLLDLEEDKHFQLLPTRSLTSYEITNGQFSAYFIVQTQGQYLCAPNAFVLKAHATIYRDWIAPETECITDTHLVMSGNKSLLIAYPSQALFFVDESGRLSYRERVALILVAGDALEASEKPVTPSFPRCEISYQKQASIEWYPRLNDPNSVLLLNKISNAEPSAGVVSRLALLAIQRGLVGMKDMGTSDIKWPLTPWIELTTSANTSTVSRYIPTPVEESVADRMLTVGQNPRRRPAIKLHIGPQTYVCVEYIDGPDEAIALKISVECRETTSNLSLLSAQSIKLYLQIHP